MVLSGDDLTKISPDRMAMLRELVPPTGDAAEFLDEAMQVGFVNLPDNLMVCLFNWDDAPATFSFRLSAASQVRDYWTGKDLGRQHGVFKIKDMAPRSARLLACR
jgi:alpha-galactosidase